MTLFLNIINISLLLQQTLVMRLKKIAQGDHKFCSASSGSRGIFYILQGNVNGKSTQTYQLQQRLTALQWA